MEKFRSVNPKGSKLEKVPDNVKVLDLPEARYRIVYNKHSIARTPEQIGSPDCLALEFSPSTGYENPIYAEEVAAAYWRKFKDPEQRPRHDALEQYVISRGTPIYFIDMNDFVGDEFIHVGSGTAEILAGGMAASALWENRKAKISRRNFLKAAAGGALAVKGAVQAGNLIAAEVGSDLLAGKEQLSDLQKTVEKVNETINPETTQLMLTSRNALWAQKLKTIAASTKKPKPDITMICGMMHSGLEDMLQASEEERLHVIYQTAFMLKNVLGKKRADFPLAPIARLEYSKREKRWRSSGTIEEPALHTLEKELWPDE